MIGPLGKPVHNRVGGCTLYDSNNTSITIYTVQGADQMSPQKSQDNMKGTSPSKLIQNGINDAWGAQNSQSSTTAQEAISKQHNQHPVDLAKGADTKATK